MRARVDSKMGLRDRVSDFAEEWVLKTVRKYGYPPFGRTSYRGAGAEQAEPAYERKFSPYTLKQLAERQSLVNNAIEEKVNQAFRRGFSDWEKEYVAKCPNCYKEFQTVEPFRDQLGEDGADIDEDDFDFDSPRVCPNCGELVQMEYPDPLGKELGERFFRRANMQNRATELMPRDETSVSQTFLGVCREVAFDIQIFDDGWMIFNRRYETDKDGNVVDWDFEGAYRAPPYLMRYSVDEEENKIGGEYYVCVDCRQKDPETYQPQSHPGPCDECGNRTYEVFAYQLDSINGEPEQYFIEGEFAHDSEYRPTRLYGLSPLISLADEAKTLARMDSWYRSAYQQRRAPRGAITLSSQNQQSVRAWNQEQMQKLNADPNHIPVFMSGESDSNPISWQPLLESPAEMQQMEMREWFKDRISAKYGVTAVFQSGGAEGTGMSQSLEIIVANRSVERLQRVFQNTFIPTFIGQLQIEGWTRELNRPEEEDEQAEAQLIGRHLQNARTAHDLGFDIEWTRNDEIDIKPETIEAPDEEEEGGGLADLFGPDPMSGPVDSDSATQQVGMRDMGFEPDDESEDDRHSNPSDRPNAEDDDVDPAGTTSTTGGRPRDPEEVEGKPNTPDHPTSDEPYRRSKDTVTTGTSGFSNPTYGGKPGEVIDIMEQLEERDELMTTEKLNILERHYQECVVASGGKLPQFETIEGSVRNRPDRDYRAFKRNQSGGWMRNLWADEFVRSVYQFVESEMGGDS